MEGGRGGEEEEEKEEGKEEQEEENDDEDDEKKRALCHTQSTLCPSFSLCGLQHIIFWMPNVRDSVLKSIH